VLDSFGIALPVQAVLIKPMKFGQLFLWKIIKIVATRCHILRLK